MAKYRRRPVDIEAEQFHGDNVDTIKQFVGCRPAGYNHEVQIQNFAEAKEYWPVVSDGVTYLVYDEVIHKTWLPVRPGDYVVKGVRGEFYPCDPDVFHELHDPVEEELDFIGDFERKQMLNYNDHEPLT